MDSVGPRDQRSSHRTLSLTYDEKIYHMNGLNVSFINTQIGEIY